MDELAHKRNGATGARNALFLVFRIGQERYALQAVDVVEVLPRLQLKPIAQAPSWVCLLYTSPSPRDQRGSRMPSSA